MQTYVVEKTDKSIKVGFKDVNLTMIAPLIKALDDDKDVEIARFIDKHPELSDGQIYVEVKKGKPEDALNRAFKKISEYYSAVNE